MVRGLLTNGRIMEDKEQAELYWMLDVFIVAQVNKQKGPLWGPGIMSAALVVNMLLFFIQSFPLNAGQKRPAHPIQVILEFGDVAHWAKSFVSQCL